MSERTVLYASVCSVRDCWALTLIFAFHTATVTKLLLPVRLNHRPVRKTRTFSFYPPTSPCFGTGDEADVFCQWLTRRPPEGSRRDLIGLILYREALRASAHSLCRLPTYLIIYFQLLAYTRTNTDSKKVARTESLLLFQFSQVRHIGTPLAPSNNVFSNQPTARDDDGDNDIHKTKTTSSMQRQHSDDDGHAPASSEH